MCQSHSIGGRWVICDLIQPRNQINGPCSMPLAIYWKSSSLAGLGGEPRSSSHATVYSTRNHRASFAGCNYNGTMIMSSFNNVLHFSNKENHQKYWWKKRRKQMPMLGIELKTWRQKQGFLVCALRWLQRPIEGCLICNICTFIAKQERLFVNMDGLSDFSCSPDGVSLIIWP